MSNQVTSNLTMASSPERNFGVNIQEEMKKPYVKAFTSEFEVSDDKLVEAIKYLDGLAGGLEVNRDSRKLNQAVEHIDNLRRRSLMDGFGVIKEYSYDELLNILVTDKMNNYPKEDFEKLVKEFKDRFGYLPSPSEFVDFYEEKKGIVKLEEKLKKLQGNQLALEQERQQEKQALQQALDYERRKRQALELKIQTVQLAMQRMKERKEDRLGEVVCYKLQRVVCKICLDKEVEVLFLPCYHLVSCQDCKEQLIQKKCPLCRDAYQGTIRVYFA